MAAKKAAPGTLKLAAVLDLNEASVLHGKLLSMRGSDVTIDASAVDRVGVQCTQVLVAGHRAWVEDKKAFFIEKASDAFQKTMQLVGIDNENLVAKEN
jgi:chemotaxis protein CheX